MKHILPCIFFFSIISIFAQEIKSPSDFLGYELGSEFSRHHEVIGYYQYLAKTVPDQVKLVEYGKTNERRPLVLAYVTSNENMSQLEDIRKEHLKASRGLGDASKAIVWLSYNVHGNESVGSEASLQTIYELLTSKKQYLKNTVVIIDPCINPDGRDRYINWYHQFKNTKLELDPNSKEHHEEWLTGRSNHYMFDLNRDWAWLTQVESQQRIKFYNQWLPHIHADFHEMGVDSPYFFAPAAEPYHEVISKFQRDFQVTIGKNHAKYFDANNWSYFTKEVYDLFYPSYGDTYPTYNGGIGLTYEQGGSGRAGLGIITSTKDTLTLNDRIQHHLTTGLSTVEISSKNAEKLAEEFKKFYQNKNFKYKSYVLNGNPDHLNALKALLSKHEIEYGSPKKGTVKGYDYQTGKIGSMPINKQSLVVSTNQSKSTLVKVLFEPKAKLSDSLTYDITAWSLPYAYGLNAIASQSLVTAVSQDETSAPIKLDKKSYAYVTDWNSMNDARFLSHLLKEGIRVRKSSYPFSIKGKSFGRGSLIIAHEDNQTMPGYLEKVEKIANEHSIGLQSTSTGLVDSGKDFGSSFVKMIAKPKIAILSGKPTSTLRFGEIWHFFEQQLNYPVSVLDGSYFKSVDLNDYEILILPDGNYNTFFDEAQLKKLGSWVKSGGKLMVMGKAIDAIAKMEGVSIKKKDLEKKKMQNEIKPYKDTQRERIKNSITGAIFKTKVDNTHPLGFGYATNYFTLKLGNVNYDYLKSGNVVYIDEATVPISGFAGSTAQKGLKNSLIFGSESVGKGHVIYMVDNPLFRGFWENGKLFFTNALFMVD